MLAAPGTRRCLLLERPTAGLDDVDAQMLLAAARRLADDGAAVVLSADGPEQVTVHATTLAVFVAGRLRELGRAAGARWFPRCTSSAGGYLQRQAGSIITSST